MAATRRPRPPLGCSAHAHGRPAGRWRRPAPCAHAQQAARSAPAGAPCHCAHAHERPPGAPSPRAISEYAADRTYKGPQGTPRPAAYPSAASKRGACGLNLASAAAPIEAARSETASTAPLHPLGPIRTLRGGGFPEGLFAEGYHPPHRHTPRDRLGAGPPAGASPSAPIAAGGSAPGSQWARRAARRGRG